MRVSGLTFPLNRLKVWSGAPQVEFSRSKSSIFVPRTQPASEIVPLVLTFTVTRVFPSLLQLVSCQRNPFKLQQTCQGSQHFSLWLECAGNGRMMSSFQNTLK